jgi:hypothetical protein
VGLDLRLKVARQVAGPIIDQERTDLAAIDTSMQVVVAGADRRLAV